MAVPAILLWGATPQSFRWVDALNDLLKVAIWISAVVAVFALRFLWNLWLAPYRRTGQVLVELSDKIALYQNTLDQVAADIASRHNAIEESMGERYGLIERGVSMRLDPVAYQVEQLAEEVKKWSGQQGSNHIYLSGVVGDLANRIAEVENGKSK